MKVLKVLITFALVLLCLPLMNVSANANNDKDFVYGGEYIFTDEELETNRIEALENAKNSKPQPRMDETVEVWKVAGTAISNESPRGLVFNQKKGGVKIGDGGGGIYWGTSSATSGTFSIGVSIGGKYGSFSVAYAPGSEYQSQGILKLIPQNMWNKYVKLYTTLKYEVTRYDIYRKNKYDSGNGTFVRSQYVPTPYSYAFYWQEV